MIEVEGSWKGKLWAIFLFWPVIGYNITTEYFENDSDYSVLIQIGIIMAWGIWGFALYRLLTILKSEFKKDKKG